MGVAGGDPSSRVSEEIKNDPPMLPLPQVPTFAYVSRQPRWTLGSARSPLQFLPPRLFGAFRYLGTPCCAPNRGSPREQRTERGEGRAPRLGFLSSSFFLNCTVISKSLESVLFPGPRPTGGGSSPPELRHARAVPQGPPGLPSRPPFASSPSQPSQPPRERPPWPKREPPHSHPSGAPGASKVTVPAGGLLPDPELQRRIVEVSCP